MELVMAAHTTTTDIQIDARTSRAVADGIGQKLQRTLGIEPRFPEQLEKLLEAMRERESHEAARTKAR